MRPEEAKRFVDDKFFSYTCFGFAYRDFMSSNPRLELAKSRALHSAVIRPSISQ